MTWQFDWPMKAGDTESFTWAWPGTLGSEAYTCEARATKSVENDGTSALATATVSAVQVSANIEVTVSFSASQTRAMAAAVPGAWFDVVQTASGGAPVSTLIEGRISFDGDVTK